MEDWGARLYGDPCRQCGYDWAIAPQAAVQLVAAVPERFAELLANADGTERHPDLGWTVGAYVCHVADNLRIWAERLVGALLAGQRTVSGYDENLLADARGYAFVPLAGALWSLRRACEDWCGVARWALEQGVVLLHARRGEQRAADVARNNAHDAHHHEWDIRRSLSATAT